MAEVYQALRFDIHHPGGDIFPDTLREERDKGFERSKNLLIVDDCRELLHILGKCFAIYADGYNILTTLDVSEAMKVLQSIPLDIILIDLYMPAMDGRKLASFAMKYYPATQIFAMSGDESDISENKLNFLGISACIRKPFHIDHLMSMVLDGQSGKNDS